MSTYYYKYMPTDYNICILYAKHKQFICFCYARLAYPAFFQPRTSMPATQHPSVFGKCQRANNKLANNFFSVTLSYIRPGTRFDLTCSQVSPTKKRRENMFQCNKITLDVSSQIIICDPSREKGAYPNFTLWLFSRSWA